MIGVIGIMCTKVRINMSRSVVRWKEVQYGSGTNAISISRFRSDDGKSGAVTSGNDYEPSTT